MLQKLAKTGCSLGILFFGERADVVEGTTKTEKQADYSVLENETGYERVKRMLQTDEFGNPSREVSSVLTVAGMSAFVGAIYGGTLYGRVAYTDFIKNNQATSFTSHMEAKKELQNKVTLTFAKGAWKWSWRLAFFCSTFVAISTTVSVYRGKNGIMEHVAAGFISGSVYKFNMGPRGWIVGGALGSVLGLIAGSATYGMLKFTGLTMDDVRYWQYHWQEKRLEQVRVGMKDYKAKEEGLLERNLRLEDEGIGNTLQKIK